MTASEIQAEALFKSVNEEALRDIESIRKLNETSKDVANDFEETAIH
jgi:hypothetical protein